MKKTIFLKWITVPIVLSFLLGCGGKGKEVRKIEGDPEILYKQALAQFNKKDYSDALKKFEELKSSFPDSPPYTHWAELKVGDCHFLKEDYVEAIAAYEEFKKTHPSHEEIPYVQFQIGMSYFNQMRTLDRDQTPTKKALSSFEYLVANYPPSLFTEKAKEKIGVCKKRLADHEFYIGVFYYNQERYRAAASRFEGLLEKFPKDPDQDKTLYLLGRSYLEFDQWEKAEAAFRKIVTEFPKSLHHAEAEAILEKGVKESKVLLHNKTNKTKKTKTKEPGKENEGAGMELDRVALVKFEEEGRQPVSLKEEKKAELRKEEERLTPPPPASKSVNKTPPKKETKKPPLPVAIRPVQEDRAQAVPPSIEAKKPALPAVVEPVQEDQIQAPLLSIEAKKPGLPVAIEPIQEDRTQVIPPSTEAKKTEPVPTREAAKEDRIPPSPSSPEVASKVEVKPIEEKRISALPSSTTASKEKEKAKQGTPPEDKESKVVDKSQPIDITSDKVEAFWKENLIIFRGNVIARQKDMVIYADSLEAVTIEEGKGIDRVTAGGNVKIQQGLRVANCQKAIFYNIDQKVVLTGDPKVSEGENIVSGDEIIVDIDKNRVEVKGGSSGRGKATIQPGEFEKLK
ncbi:MAG: lipopolysaccharide transport periplasmic protein LptA [Thermodesulfobacteriota bacterium]|jgi:outer membrane protein assembly factor BamD